MLPRGDRLGRPTVSGGPGRRRPGPGARDGREHGAGHAFGGGYDGPGRRGRLGASLAGGTQRGLHRDSRRRRDGHLRGIFGGRRHARLRGRLRQPVQTISGEDAVPVRRASVRRQDGPRRPPGSPRPVRAADRRLPVLDRPQRGAIARIGTVNWKFEPSPTLLSTQILPPCSSTIWRLMARPRPVPTTWLVRLLSNRSYRLNSWPMNSGGMPTP